MKEFIAKHQKDIVGTLSGFDRVRFRGTFRILAVAKLLMSWLAQQRVLIKDFGEFSQSLTQRLQAAVEVVARGRGQDVQYLQSSKVSKEALVKELIRREGLTEGVVCVLSVVEPCRSYEVRRHPETKTLVLEAGPRKCWHWYVYFLDATWGLCPVRIPSWLPFTVPVCVNGREWLCRELTRQGIGFERRDNCLARVDDVVAAQRILDAQPWEPWSTLLDGLAGRACPVLLQLPGYGGLTQEYYWSADFGVHRASEQDPHGPKKWRKLRKGVVDLPRRAEISQATNARYLAAHAAVDCQTPLGQVADQLAKPVVSKGSRSRGLNPLTGIDARLITILLRGEFALNGFRNRDVRDLLFPPAAIPAPPAGSPPADAETLSEQRRQSGQVTRLLRLFRAHGLIKKIPRTHRYQLTTAGRRILPTFPTARAASTQALRQIAA